MEAITITPLRRQVQQRSEPKPLPGPRSLQAKLQVRALGTLAKVAPALTVDVMYRYYFTPSRYRASQAERELTGEASRTNQTILGHDVTIYEWGSHAELPWEQPPEKSVLLVHGWSGAASQMTALVKPLQRAGYRVRAIDWPAHGKSAGEQINVSLMANILCELQRDEAPSTLIAHSLGGSATLIAAARGLVASRFVFIAAGARLDRYPVRFTRAAGMDDSIGEALRDRLFKEFGEEVMFAGAAAGLAPSLATPALFIHDVDDAEMPHEDSRALALRWGTNGRLVSTAGLGHTRILRDEPVIEEITAFLPKV